MRKLIVISAPSGSGKTSIVKHILNERKDIVFSISACSRKKRKKETNGKDYFFIGVKAFQDKIKEDAFVEWEEVYPNQYYGTLKSEIERLFKQEQHIIFDLDVVGALNIKRYYNQRCLAIFVMPPSIKALEERLNKRGADVEEEIRKRLGKAKKEMESKNKFDQIIINDNLKIACQETLQAINNFIILK